MKTLIRTALALSALLACAPAIAQADPTIVGLPAAASITGAELLPVAQGGQRVVTTLTAACSTHAASVAAPTVTSLPGAGVIGGGELVALYQGRALVVSTVASLCATHAAFAGDPAVGLPGAGALTGAELVPLYQGTQRVTATVAQITTLFGAGPTPGTLDFSDPTQSAFIL